MANGIDNDERELRWMETPKGRAIINAVSLTVLLMITQHFGYIVPVSYTHLTLPTIYSV